MDNPVEQLTVGQAKKELDKRYGEDVSKQQVRCAMDEADDPWIGYTIGQQGYRHVLQSKLPDLMRIIRARVDRQFGGARK